MNLQSCTRFTLPNGLEVVCAEMPSVRSVSLGLYLRVGSRYEQAGVAGISHFLEHMLFKGCQGWPTARDIANEIEGRGGYLNASTGQEFTSFWVRVGARYGRQALNLLTAMVRSPLLDASECERERSVILDEIAMYRDVPEDYVGQLSGEALWGDHPLGREIAGEPETVAALSPGDLRHHHQLFYRPDAAVLAIAGAIDVDDARASVVASFGDWSVDGRALEPLPTFLPAPPIEAQPRHRAQIRASEQAHLQLALPGPARDHPDRFAFSVLNALAGDGMSSRLWQRLREERGLAYSIGTFVNMFADSGVLGVYGGCEVERLFETLDETMAIWQELQEKPVAADELQLFKEYLKGRLELSSEDSSSVASWWGRQVAAEMEMLTLDQVLAAIDQVESADLQRLAQEWWQPSRLTLAYVGPLADEGVLKAWLGAGAAASSFAK